MARTLFNLLPRSIVRALILVVCIFVSGAYCQNDDSNARSNDSKKSAPRVIQTQKEFYDIIETSGSDLIMVDFYADWCSPCKILSPILEDIAKKNYDKVTVYKLNVDKHHALASKFRVSGIPVVIFFKNKKEIYKMYGLQPKDRYIAAIEELSSKK